MRKRSVLLAGVLTLGVVLALPVGLTFAASNAGPAAPAPSLTLPSLPIPGQSTDPGSSGSQTTPSPSTAPSGGGVPTCLPSLPIPLPSGVPTCFPSGIPTCLPSLPIPLPSGFPIPTCLPGGTTESPVLAAPAASPRSEEHTSELQSHVNLVCRLLLEKKKKSHQLQPVRKHTAEN